MRKKILAIEDDKNVRENIRSFLTEEGFEVKSAKNGLEGIETAINWIPDLIISDVIMPGKNGYQVLEELSKNKKTKLIPFIFLSAKVERKDMRLAMRLGADDYIFKPFGLNELSAAVNIRLQKSDMLKAAIAESSDPAVRKNNNKYDQDDKILVKAANKMQFIKICEIKFIQSENPYCSLKLTNGKSYLLRGTITEWEIKLPEKVFIRIHRATIINSGLITKIEKRGVTTYQVRLEEEDGAFIISKRYAAKLKGKFS